ncbi:MAG: NAD(P)-dependent oxidoreductase [Comamonas sp.]|nr:NAD(P)-dependent oxidoreductase [Comamonas sp.]
MRVLLTGGNGFIGRHVRFALEQIGVEVFVAGRRASFGDKNYIQADLLNQEDRIMLIQNIKPTHFIHLAWYVEHGKYSQSLENIRWLESTCHLAEIFCTNGGKQIIISGSCMEYDWNYGLLSEDLTPTNSKTVYGVAKNATRRIVGQICSQHGVSMAWGRIFFLYGKYENRERLIPSLIEVFQNKRKPFGINGAAFRDFLHVSDVAEGFVKLLTTQANGVYNLCSGEPSRLADVVTTLASLLDADPDPVLALATERPGEPPLLVGENLKLKALGWRPTLNLAQGLEHCL